MGRGVRRTRAGAIGSRAYPTLPGLGGRLREARLAAGLTQAGLAQPEYTREYVSLVESGKANPSSAALRHFADRLGVALAALAHPGAPSHGGLAALSEAAALLRAAAVAASSESERRTLEAAGLALKGALDQLLVGN